MDLYEKQGEPKFHEGEWIINSQGTLRHIINVDKEGYQTDEGWASHDTYEKTFHSCSGVDLEKEIKNGIDNLPNLYCYMEDLFNGNEEEGVYPIPDKVTNELFEFAKHFFELGLKAKGG